ncbi:MAG: (Fe-S)-binding protein [Dehalococcoidales bacterium]|nr:(Fe-S)-binding protein [Dehalococcoidales bacterium]
MQPAREIFWNIDQPWIMYLLGAITIIVLLWALFAIPRRWRRGAGESHPANFQRLRAFLTTAIVDGLIHRRFFGARPKDPRPRELYAGLMHFFIFAGFGVLLLGAFLDFISHYFFHFMEGNFYLGYSLVTDTFGILAVIGTLMAIFRRYALKPARLDNLPDDAVTILLILVILLTGFVIEGLRIAATELETNPAWAKWSPGGYAFALAFSGLSREGVLAWHAGMWWFHAVLVFGTVVYFALYNTKLFHIFWSPLNVFFRNLGPRGALVPVDLEKAEHFGAGKIEDFTWKQLLDLDACTRCGRCQDACPAHASGKALNPKSLVQNLKKHLYAAYPGTICLKPAADRPEMVGAVITEEIIWDCTTCAACQEACPVFVEHIDKVIAMRRNLAMEKGQFPDSVQDALKSLSARAHPYRGTTLTRTSWTEGMDVPLIGEAKDASILYWVGCSAALDERNTKVARATAKLLRAAGVKFAILGDAEACCGDPARRLGDEYLFQTLCQQNIEALKSHGVRKIVTTCPHCFNSLRHEYPRFGGDFDVVHHSQYLLALLEEGRLRLKRQAAPTPITYHDSCYLGRYNDIYDEPRRLLKATGAAIAELPRRRSASFCCGGGGGHMWMEEPPDKRVNHRRIEEIIASGAPCVATACPYCLTMFEDAIKAKSVEERLVSRDLAEVLAGALEE